MIHCACVFIFIKFGFVFSSKIFRVSKTERVMGDAAYNFMRSSQMTGTSRQNSVPINTSSAVKLNYNGDSRIKRKPATPPSALPAMSKRQKYGSSVVISPPPTICFANVGGMDDTLIHICRLLRPICQPQVYEELGITPLRGLLLHGPPGTGKTLLAHAIVGQLNMPFIKLSAPEIISGISGQSEQKLRDVFSTAAQNAPCIVFIDEIDAIASPREDAGKDMEKRIVSQLLSCMDSIDANVLVLGATNRLSSMDAALRRAGRFDHEVACGIPNYDGRKKILQLLVKDLKLNDAVMFDELAEWTPGYVGADLKAFIREAACHAVDRIFRSLSEHRAASVFEAIKPLEVNDSILVAAPIPSRFSCAVDVTLAEALTWVTSTKTSEIGTASLLLNYKNGPLTVSQQRKFTVQCSADNNNIAESNSLASANVSIELADFQYALQVVQPSAKREGFATVPDVSWSDIGALDAVRRELKLALVAPIRYRAAFERLGLNVSLGVLLCGPPGCGKTLLAKAVANESGLNFISVKGPELLNMYVGESERGVRQVFERARTSAPCVIFFDELDALVPRRTASSDSNVTSRVVNQLLVEMDGLVKRAEVFVLAATNRPDILDPALLRPGRFDKQVYVGLPSPVGVVDILEAITAHRTKPPVSAEVDFNVIANDERVVGFTGADVASLVREASMMALKDVLEQQVDEQIDKRNTRSIKNTDEINARMNDIVVSSEHFERALQRIKPSVSASERIRYARMKSTLGL